MQDRGVEIVRVDLVLDGGGAELVGLAVDRAALDAAARHDDGERAGVVVPTRIFGAVAVAGGFAAEFATPDDERGIEEAALLEIVNEGGERLVDFAGLGGEASLELLVMIPAVVPDLDHADAAFDEAAGDEELLALLGRAVGGAGVGRLLVDIEGIERLRLHAERNLVALEPSLERGVALEILGVQFVELVNEIELPALFVLRDVRVADVLNHLRHARGLRVDARALIDAGEEGRLVVGRAARGQAAAAEGDEAGEILVFRAETVDEPRTHAGFRDAEGAGVHEHRGDLVGGDVGPHRADDGKVVRVGSGFGEHLASFEPALAVLGELERRRQRDVVAGDRLAVHLRQHRLRVPRIEVGRRALGEDVDDGLGFAGEVRRLGRQWAGGDLALGLGRDEVVRIEDVGERQGTQSHAHPAEELAAGQKVVLEIGRNPAARMLGRGRIRGRERMGRHRGNG